MASHEDVASEHRRARTEPGGRRFATGDPGRAEQVIRDSYRVTGGVRISGDTAGFRFSQSVLPGPGFALTRFQCTNEVSYRGPQGESVLCVDEVRAGRLSFVTGRGEVRTDAGGVCLVPPHEPWRASTAGIDLVPLLLDRAAVATAAAGLCGIGPDALVFTGLEPVSPATAGHWLATAAHVRGILADPDLAAAPLVAGGALRMLTAALLTTFPNTALEALDGRPAPGADVAAPRVIRRAVQFIESHAEQDIDVAEIAAAARIGTRGLQAAFRRHRDQTPLECLRQVRMERAHRDLKAADPTRGDRVGAIAARWGFANAGRFAVEYRRAYGRSPGQTLRE